MNETSLPSSMQNVLARSLNQAIKEPHTHLAVYIMNRDGNARLDFIQNLDYKFVELLSVTFLRSPEDTIRSQISFRYNAMRSKLAVTTARLQEVTNVVKLKNPSLLLALQGRGPGAIPAMGTMGTPTGAGGSTLGMGMGGMAGMPSGQGMQSMASKILASTTSAAR